MPPPIWVILCSVRTVVTTALYKFVLRRDVTALQFIGASLIVASIIVAKLGGRNQKCHLTHYGQVIRILFKFFQCIILQKSKNLSNISKFFHKLYIFSGDVLSSEAGNTIPLLAIIYAAVSSLNSVGVSVYQEQLFKV